jgi:hypothetical protein
LGVEQSQLGIDVGLHRPGRHCGRKVIWHPEPPPSRLAASWAVDKVSAALPDCH